MLTRRRRWRPRLFAAHALAFIAAVAAVDALLIGWLWQWGLFR